MARGRPRKPVGRTRLSHRLLLLIEQQNMSVKDLAIVFESHPYQTVFSWVHRNREPQKYYRGEVYERLEWLEKLADKYAKKKSTIVPIELKQRERGDYVRNLVARSFVPQRAAAG